VDQPAAAGPGPVVNANPVCGDRFSLQADSAVGGFFFSRAARWKWLTQVPSTTSDPLAAPGLVRANQVIGVLRSRRRLATASLANKKNQPPIPTVSIDCRQGWLALRAA